MTLAEIFAKHRSIRRYRPDPIGHETIAGIVGEAMSGASSSGNLNAYSVIATMDVDGRRRLWELHLQQDMILRAPCVLTICADHHRNRSWLKARGARDGFDNFLGYHVAAFDAVILAQNIALAAQARGFGICYLGTTLYETRALRAVLQLPETVFPATSLVIGVPDEEPAKRDRMPTDAILHFERYRTTGPDDVDKLFGDKERRTWDRYRSMPEVRDQIDELGITNAAQYYTSTAKYDPGHQRAVSRYLLASVAEAGFMAESVMPGTEESRAMAAAQKQAEAYNRRDLEACLACYTDDVQLCTFGSEGPPVMVGKEAMRGRFADLFQRSPLLDGQIVRRMVLGRYVVDEEFITGHVRGHGEAVRAIAIYETRDDLIAKVWFIR